MTEALRMIQNKLNAPKNQYNSFGKYSYRSCESILEAVKPLLKEYNAEVVLTDDIVQIGDRIYVKATAIFTAGEDEVICTAFAREPDAKKGMDEAQVTGATSSYARKYALNGLFLIDDNKDPDTDERHIEQQARQDARQGRQPQAPPGLEDKKVGPQQIEQLTAFAAEVGVSIEAICERFHVGTLQDLTMTQWVKAIRNLEATQKKGSAA